MNVISASYGNDSIAMIQWAYENLLFDVTVVYCDTGWAHPGWDKRVAEGEALARNYGFKTARIESMGMAELVRMKKGWPGNGQQFCTIFLKGLPFLEWIDDVDQKGDAFVLVGKRREESLDRADTPGYIDDSEYHGGRTLWHPLFMHTEKQRNALIHRAGFEVLPHRSRECEPCVNANRADFMLMGPAQIERVNDLEVEIGKPMFRPKRFGAIGIFGVMTWARFGPQTKRMKEAEPDLFSTGCDGAYGCGL